MLNIEFFYLALNCFIDVILFILIYKNKQSIRRKFSFHYNSQAKQRIKYLKNKQKEILKRLEELETTIKK